MVYQHSCGFVNEAQAQISCKHCSLSEQWFCAYDNSKSWQPGMATGDLFAGDISSA